MAELDVVSLDDAVPASYWRIVLLDIKRGDGIVVVTLKSGEKLEGQVDPQDGMQQQAITLKTVSLQARYSGGVRDYLATDGGWHVIDYTQVAAITARTRGSYGER